VKHTFEHKRKVFFTVEEHYWIIDQHV